MNTGFACPTCQAPLVLTFVAIRIDDPVLILEPCPCPNPFCHMDLPPRQGDLSLTYALVGTVIDTEEQRA